jgi:A/G-specific adenine glycosylase
LEKTQFIEKLLSWYDINKRPLPWRDVKNPYFIYLSEIILQQTRVAQGLQYYDKFVSKYPTIFELARAKESEVLSLWQGLGYYSRAKNLHACAKTIAKNHNGKFPQSYEELQKLKGIGKYTAAAIASFAFGITEPVLDGNVYRVISRLFGYDIPINTPQAEKIFRKKVKELISENHPDLFNQAIMEFGALHCVPSSPDCQNCIFRSSCFANKHNLQKNLPVKLKQIKKRNRYFTYLVFEINDDLLFKERIEKDIWSGLCDFPLIEGNVLFEPQDLNITNLNHLDGKFKVVGFETVSNLLLLKNKIVSISHDYKHVLTHQTIFARFLLIKIDADIHNDKRLEDFFPLKYVNKDQLENLPKPVLINNYLNDYIFKNLQNN